MPSHEHVAHWDDARKRRFEIAEIAADWTNLGRACGSEELGASRIDLTAGNRATPAHVHSGEEEIFYVLSGRGLSWQDGKTYEVRAGDCIVHLEGKEAHTLIGGEGGLSAIAFGERGRTEACRLPRAGVMWLGTSWVEDAAEAGHPFKREAEAGPLPVPEPSERPANIVNLDDVEPLAVQRARCRMRSHSLGGAAGARRTGLRYCVIEPGAEGVPPHNHAVEEELFVVLDGDGVVVLGEEEHPVRGGSLIARPGGTHVAHSFRAGEAGLTYLAYGQRVANDVIFYPRSGKVMLAGIVFRPEPLGYWEGEE